MIVAKVGLFTYLPEFYLIVIQKYCARKMLLSQHFVFENCNLVKERQKKIPIMVLFVRLCAILLQFLTLYLLQ